LKLEIQPKTVENKFDNHAFVGHIRMSTRTTQEQNMSTIKTITKYVFDKQEFSTLQEIQSLIENRIGKIIDQTVNKTGTMGVKEKRIIFDMLLENKEELSKCFGVMIDTDPDSLQGGGEINILDI